MKYLECVSVTDPSEAVRQLSEKCEARLKKGCEVVSLTGIPCQLTVLFCSYLQFKIHDYSFRLTSARAMPMLDRSNGLRILRGPDMCLLAGAGTVRPSEKILSVLR